MTASRSPLRICVVDDDPLMLDAFSSAITGLGHHSMPTLNVNMALEVVAHSRVDVILVDIFMPEQDGLDLIMAVRGVTPKIRIVAMTGGGSIGINAVLGMARGMGADATLAKPFSPSELESALLGDRPRLV